jgi:hypothetical protein
MKAADANEPEADENDAEAAKPDRKGRPSQRAVAKDVSYQEPAAMQAKGKYVKKVVCAAAVLVPRLRRSTCVLCYMKHAPWQLHHIPSSGLDGVCEQETECKDEETALKDTIASSGAEPSGRWKRRLQGFSVVSVQGQCTSIQKIGLESCEACFITGETSCI